MEKATGALSAAFRRGQSIRVASQSRLATLAGRWVFLECVFQDQSRLRRWLPFLGGTFQKFGLFPKVQVSSSVLFSKVQPSNRASTSVGTGPLHSRWRHPKVIRSDLLAGLVGFPPCLDLCRVSFMGPAETELAVLGHARGACQ